MNASLKPAFIAGHRLNNTRSMLNSAESKVFFITVSSKRQKKKSTKQNNKKQCQDQFVNKSRSHPLCSIFFFCLVFMDEYIKRHA